MKGNLFVTGILLVCLFVDSKNSAAQQIIQHDDTALTGPWMYYPFTLLEPGDPLPTGRSVYFPHLWNADDAAIGFASYRSIVHLSPNLAKQPLSLYMPDVYCSYELWIDGRALGGNGLVGMERSDTYAYWRPRLISFTPQSDSIEIVLQVANFQHHRGGLGKVPHLGIQTDMQGHNTRIRRMGEILFVVLLFIGLSCGFLLFKYRESTLLFFGCLTVSWAFRTIFSNEYLVVQWFPEIPWVSVVRVEYITLYLSTLFGLLFVAGLFPKDFSRSFKWLYIIAAVLFTITTLFTAPLFFTQYVMVYLTFSGLLIVAILFILMRAFINDRRGISLLLGCLLVGSLLFGYVILAYLNVTIMYEELFNIGFLLIFMLATAALYHRLAFSE